MAMIKLRPVAGDSELGHKILRSRDEFVYSGRPLDKENILHLRRRQAKELVRPGTVNAKYSPGGLVEIEYFVQAWQTAVGHLDARVRVGNTIDAISRLADGGHMRSERTGELREAYSFLRRLIDALRAVRGNAKDLTIPDTDSREFSYLAHRLEYDSSDMLEKAISTQMNTARMVWGDDIPSGA